MNRFEQSGNAGIQMADMQLDVLRALHGERLLNRKKRVRGSHGRWNAHYYKRFRRALFRQISLVQPPGVSYNHHVTPRSKQALSPRLCRVVGEKHFRLCMEPHSYASV
jgi:hypothetical protein